MFEQGSDVKVFAKVLKTGETKIILLLNFVLFLRGSEVI